MKKPKIMAKRRITDAIDLPSDVLLDLPNINYDGIGTVRCENYKGIIEYNNNCIRFKTKLGEVKIIGDHLTIRDFVCTTLVCSGDVRSIEFFNKTKG